MKTVFVVTCEQAYASFYCVVGVFTDRAKAEACCKGGADYCIEEFTLDENTFKR